MNIEELNTQLDYLDETKSLIKQAIINKGQNIGDNDTFRSYVQKINDISTVNTQAKSVTPTTSQQVITPDTPTYNALSKVTVAGVTSSIDSNIKTENIKSGVSILGVSGKSSVVETNDANATASDIADNKTAYVNGQKIYGELANIAAGTSSIYNNGNVDEETTTLKFTKTVPVSCIFRENADVGITVNKSDVATEIGLTANKIKDGETILGITGTYVGATMKEYNSVNAMNNDIANITNGEVVKVVTGGETTYYIKEEGTSGGTITQMVKLIKETETISPEEYEENIELVDEILGEE